MEGAFGWLERAFRCFGYAFQGCEGTFRTFLCAFGLRLGVFQAFGNAFAAVGNPPGCFGNDHKAIADAFARFYRPTVRHFTALVEAESLPIIRRDLFLVLEIPSMDHFRYAGFRIRRFPHGFNRFVLKRRASHG
ncbi:MULTISPECIES: hypothetical protein [Methylomonas]|uniref:hypothetical protein n=1 Tax=Methylomonas TaxID=416 RepID=UPI0012F6CE8D|nr:hypothetical protein [Methylomonas koyamae]